MRHDLKHELNRLAAIRNNGFVRIYGHRLERRESLVQPESLQRLWLRDRQVLSAAPDIHVSARTLDDVSTLEDLQLHNYAGVPLRR